MALELVWTKRAIAGYDRIINYLQEQWTDKEIVIFIRQSHEFFDLLKRYPEMLEKQKSINMFTGGQSISTLL